MAEKGKAEKLKNVMNSAVNRLFGGRVVSMDGVRKHSHSTKKLSSQK